MEVPTDDDTAGEEMVVVEDEVGNLISICLPLNSLASTARMIQTCLLVKPLLFSIGILTFPTAEPPAVSSILSDAADQL